MLILKIIMSRKYFTITKNINHIESSGQGVILMSDETICLILQIKEEASQYQKKIIDIIDNGFGEMNKKFDEITRKIEDIKAISKDIKSVR
jgi:hypothetical protein